MRYLLAIILIISGIVIGTAPASAQSTQAPESIVALNSSLPNEQWTGWVFYMPMLIGEEYYYFNLAKFPAVGIVSNAKVSLTIDYLAAPARIFVFRSSSAFDSATVTYNTRPPVFNLVHDAVINTTGTIVFDVTAAVNSSYPEPLTLHFSSSKYTLGAKPSLIMTYSLASQQPPTPQPTPTAEPTPTPTPAVPELIHCYDFETDGADFFGTANWSGAVNDGAVAVFDNHEQFTISAWLTIGDGQDMTIQSGGGTWGGAFGHLVENIESVASGAVTMPAAGSPVTSLGLRHYVIVGDGDTLTLYRDKTAVDSTTQHPANVLSLVNLSTKGILEGMSIYSGVMDTNALYSAGLQNCLDQIDPTAVTISQQLISLPSGGIASVQMSVTAGELFVAGGMLAVLLTMLFVVIRSYADKGSVQ